MEKEETEIYTYWPKIMSSSQELMIFVPADDRGTQPISLPCTYEVDWICIHRYKYLAKIYVTLEHCITIFSLERSKECV